MILDLVMWAAENPAVGLHGLLAAALKQKPANPKLKALAAAWAGLAFDAKPPKCPYPGMAPFQLDSEFPFYGRSAEIKDAVHQLHVHPFLTVIGASGSGKSSLVFAGVIPAMQKSSLFAEHLTAVTVRPGQKPMDALAAALHSTDTTPESIIADAKALASGAPHVLIIDQFEETYTGADKAQAGAFQETLLHLIGAPSLYLILTVRADFYPDLMNSPLWDSIKAHRLEVTALRGEGMQEAIAQPAKDVGVTVEPALVQKLMADAGIEPGVLPFLQETLVLLWEELTKRTLTLAAYQNLSGEDGRTGLQVAMGRRADQAYSELTDDGKALAQRIFLRLVQFGEGRPDTRRQLAETDLRAADDNAALFEAVLTHLIDRRLLTVDNHDAGPARKVDIAHEALITGWKRLDDWVKDRRSAEQARRQLEAKTEEWIRLGSGEGGLLDRVQLKEADAYLTSPGGKLLGVSTNAAAFIAASRKAADPGWNTWATVGLAVAAFALVALMGAALFIVQTILLSVAARVALLAFWALMLVGAVGVLWALRRSEPHFLKHWSHNVVTHPIWSSTLALVLVSACAVWISVGGWLAPLEQECAEEGFGRGEIASQIAVIGENIDPFYPNMLARILRRVSNKSAEGLVTSKEVAQQCRFFFQYAVALGATKSPDGSVFVYADKIDLLTGDRTQLAIGVSNSGDCRDIAYLAADVVQEFGLGIATDDETLFASGGLSCQAALMNEKGMEAGIERDYATAEHYFQEALAIEPNFVDAKVNLGWAFYNTGRAEQGVDKLREAQSLLPISSYSINNHLGRACFRAGDMACAEAAFTEAIDLAKNTENRLWRLQDLFQVFQMTGDLEQADRTLKHISETLAEMTPDRKHHDILLPFDQGILAYERGQWNKAMDYLQTADRYQNFDVVDWAKIALMAVLDRDRSDEVRRTYHTWDEEITYLLAKTAEKLGDRAASCRYLERYASTPSTSIPGEAERRAEAQKMTVTLGCEIR